MKKCHVDDDLEQLRDWDLTEAPSPLTRKISLLRGFSHTLAAKSMNQRVHGCPSCALVSFVVSNFFNDQLTEITRKKARKFGPFFENFYY
jgi:hypothetical protein